MCAHVYKQVLIVSLPGCADFMVPFFKRLVAKLVMHANCGCKKLNIAIIKMKTMALSFYKAKIMNELTLFTSGLVTYLLWIGLLYIKFRPNWKIVGYGR